MDLDLSGYDDVGYKALMVTVSDLAAMGAGSDYALVSVAAPPGTDLDRLGVGVAEAAERDGLRGGGRRSVGIADSWWSRWPCSALSGRADRMPVLSSGRGPGRATASS